MAEKENKKPKITNLEEAIAAIKKAHGEDAIMKLGETNFVVDTLSSGILSLDLATGGYPKGRITEIYGKFGSGKTTLALHAIAEAQRQGKMVAYVDVEHALNPFYAATIGVDVDEVLIAQPSSAEEAIDII